MLPNERLESFWDALWLGIRTFLCFKILNWRRFGVNFHENYGRQWPESEKRTPRVAYRRRFARLMHSISPCVRSKRAHKQEIHVLKLKMVINGISSSELCFYLQAMHIHRVQRMLDTRTYNDAAGFTRIFLFIPKLCTSTESNVC